MSVCLANDAVGACAFTSLQQHYQPQLLYPPSKAGVMQGVTLAGGRQYQQQQRQQQQQQQGGSLAADRSRAPRRRGCTRCITCDATLSSYAHCCGSSGGSEEYADWWPSGIATPTIYYHLRHRQLEHNIRQQALKPAAIWREAADVSSSPSELRLKRGLFQLSLGVPTSCTNIAQNDTTVVYRGTVRVALHRLKAASPAAETQPAPTPSAATPSKLTTPATPVFSPRHAAVTPAPCYVQQATQQPRQQQQHTTPASRTAPKPGGAILAYPSSAVAFNKKPQGQQPQQQSALTRSLSGMRRKALPYTATEGQGATTSIPSQLPGPEMSRHSYSSNTSGSSSLFGRPASGDIKRSRTDELNTPPRSLSGLHLVAPSAPSAEQLLPSRPPTPFPFQRQAASSAVSSMLTDSFSCSNPNSAFSLPTGASPAAVIAIHTAAAHIPEGAFCIGCPPDQQSQSYFKRQLRIKSEQAFACQEVVDLAPAASEETSTLMGGITSMPVVWWRSLVGGINRKISRE